MSMAPPPVGHSAPENSPQWEIATACSTLLSRHFRTGGLFEGMVITVDDEAIQAGIEGLEPVAGGNALFCVTDIASPAHTDTEGIAFGNYRKYISSEQREVDVAVTRFSGTQGKAIREKGLPDTIEDYMSLPSPIAATPRQTQKTAHHELRHLVDSVDEEIVALEEEDKEKVANRERMHKKGLLAAEKIMFGLMGANVGASAFAWVSPRIITLGTGAIAGAAGWLYARKHERESVEAINKLYEHYSYSASMSEKRARVAARRSKHFPQIIQVVSARELELDESSVSA